MRPQRFRLNVLTATTLGLCATVIVPGLVSQKAIAAAPTYACKATANGWACTQDGKPLPEIVFEDNTSNRSSAGATVRVERKSKEELAQIKAQKEEEARVALLGEEPEAETPPPLVDDGSTRPQLDDGIDWGYCKQEQTIVDRGVVENQEDTYVYADGSDQDTNEKVSTFEGDVYLRQGEQLIAADKVVVDHNEATLKANGNVIVENSGFRGQGSELDYDMDEKSGELKEVAYRVPGTRIRGTSDRTSFVNKQSNHENVTYTTCRPGNDAWSFDTKSLRVDHEEGMAYADASILRISGLPVFYTPYLAFPIDDRRHSGFLMPSFGSSDKGGIDIKTPYYYNLAPNYDFTFIPRIMSDRGIQLGGEYRFLSERTKLTLAGDFMPDDSEYAGSNSRGQFHASSSTQWDDNWHTSVHLGIASDDDYISDTGTNLGDSSNSQLKHEFVTSYSVSQFNASARILDYQMLGSTAAPYQLLPQLRMNWSSQSGETSLFADFSNFAKSNSVEGQRLHLKPSISFPLERDWGFIKPRFSAYLSAYNLSGQTSGLSSSPTAAIGAFSLDNGLFFERETTMFDDAIVQTLEPRLHFLYVPYTDQQEIPDFDTGTTTGSFNSLFRENRFSGHDRVGDTKQVTLALTSRALDASTGRELMHASIGQSYYFSDRKVTTGADSLDTSDTSSVFAEAGYNPSKQLKTLASFEWDSDNNRIEQALLQANYAAANNKILNAVYRLNDNNNNTIDLSAAWPMGNEVAGIARWNYSFDEARSLDKILGIEYGKCCWRVRALVQDYSSGSSDADNLTFFIQLQLDGLARLGDSLKEILESKIDGYKFDQGY